MRAGAERNAALWNERAGAVVCVPEGSVGARRDETIVLFQNLVSLGCFDDFSMAPQVQPSRVRLHTQKEAIRESDRVSVTLWYTRLDSLTSQLT